MVAGAWRRAEVHMVADGSWSTPQARLEAFAELHEAMRGELRERGVGEVWTFMDDMKAFGRRLQRLGWQKIARQVWGKRT